MKKLISYINPVSSYRMFKKSTSELLRYLKYSKILTEIDEEGKLKEAGIRLEKNLMYVGVNLNPDLLKYTDGIEQESYERFAKRQVQKGIPAPDVYPATPQSLLDYKEWQSAGNRED